MSILCSMVGASFSLAATALVRTTITAFGGAAISTAQSKFGGSSLGFGDGVGDYYTVNVPSTSYFGGTGDMTFEFWYYRAATSSGLHITDFRETGIDGNSWTIVDFEDGRLGIRQGGYIIATNFGMPTLTWTHCALVKSGTTIKFYKNGTLTDTTTGHATTFTNRLDCFIGANYTDSSAGSNLNGFIDELRISSGQRYVANFVAPTAAFVNDATTLLLIHADGTNGSTVVTDDTGVTVTPAAASVNEGSSLTFNVASVGAADQTLYYTLTNSGDFAVSSGSFSLVNNVGSFSVTPTADTTTEGAETFTASVRTVSTSGTIIATSSAVTINDTSLTPAPASGSWTTYSLSNVVSSVSQYTGVGKSSIGIHGVQNTDNLVLSIAAQNSARTAWTLTPMVVNLTTGAIAKGTATAITASNTGGNYWAATSAGDDTGAISYGLFSVGHFDGVKYVHRMYGFNFTNWGSISTSTVPTITLSTVFTDTLQVNSEVNTAYAGGNRFVSVWRDNAGGDLTAFKAYTYTGSGAPTAYSVKSSAEGNRGSGYIATWRNGITVGTNFAGHSAMAGNNANPLVTFVTTGNASNCKNYNKADVVPSDSRSSFDGDTLRDVASSHFFLHGSNKGSTNTYEMYAGQVTNANTPTALPTVTYGAVNNTAPAGSIVKGDGLTKAYLVYNDTNMVVTPVTLDPTTRALTKGTYAVATGSLGNGNNAYRGFYHSTYGQWIINAQWDGNTNIYLSKLNP